MNALVRATATAVPRAANMSARRMNSTSAFSIQSLRNNVWLQDEGAYPIIGILGVAVLGCSGFATYVLFGHPDVRINRSKRQSVVRTWGN
eukprot:CAMPEP_0116852842 /NCGR_PEP_ID=MMETSP0418-20121206/17542_1 /TAXON_ID=1158023 /ORGANISM="Astrosyne radiata, Strain 13vi08-1A" /LENGTH=89 /DNA_ID=CAMNT_0004485099 /DNA_START=138 /DNA_END=407 /DNA_ORIENTATION=-